MSHSVSYFISDLHLCPTRPAITKLFCHFLKQQTPQADALYILGDLFEYWAGDDDLADPFNTQICHALHACSQTIPIYLMVGNRDFLIGEAFAHATHITLINDPTLIHPGGVPTLLMHGDTLCSDDIAYQNFRHLVRTPHWRTEFLARPLEERKAQIEALRRRSEEEKQHKPAALMDVTLDTVVTTLRHHDYPRLIHGHTHRQNTHTHTIDSHTCERWVLGDWHNHSGNYLAIDKTGCHIRELQLKA